MYLKQYNKNAAIRACTNVIKKRGHGHVLNVRFSKTSEMFSKVRNNGVAEISPKAHTSNEPGLQIMC